MAESPIFEWAMGNGTHIGYTIFVPEVSGRDILINKNNNDKLYFDVLHPYITTNTRNDRKTDELANQS